MSAFRRSMQIWRAVVQQTTVSSIKRSFFTFCLSFSGPGALTRSSIARTRARTTYSLATASSVRLVNSRGVNVEWTEREGGSSDYFHGVWLRHNCHCSLCLDQDSNQKKVDIAHLDDPTVTHAAVNGDNVQLTWHASVGEHKGFVPLQFLKENCYSDEIIKRYGKKFRPDEMVVKMDQIPEVDAKAILSSDEGLWSWLWNLTEYGMCIINDVPTVPGSAIPLAERISYIQETLYGRTFDVVVSEKAVNLAYTSGNLPLHNDLVMYTSPPGIQILHCIKNDAIGGESRLLDAFTVLEEMRVKHPEEFRILTRVPAVFQRIHLDRESPAHFVRQWPHIVLGENEEIIAINWNQRIHGPLNVAPADVEPYFKAYVLLGKLLESSERILQFRLLPGQAISMNNWRVLHGRNAFQGGSRYLQGMYVGLDEFKSRFQILDAIYGNG